MRDKPQFVETIFGKMRICPTCKFEDPRDNQWFLNQFDGKTCRVCKLEAEAAARRAKGIPEGRGRAPTLDLAKVAELRARYQQGDISQLALAEQFGVSRRHVNRIVKGEARHSVGGMT